VAEALNIHQGLVSRFPQLANEAIDVEGIVEAHGLDTYKATATLYEAFAEKNLSAPNNFMLWSLMMEGFFNELDEFFLSFIPGYSTFIEFQNGNYFAAGLALVVDLAGPLKAAKIAKNTPKVKAGVNAYLAVKAVINKIWNSGGHKVFNNIPSSWNQLGSKKLITGESGGKGFRFVNPQSPSTELRIMEGNLNSSFSHNRNPYVRMHKGNNYLDKFGNPVDANHPDFELLTHLPLYELPESTIINFFK
jgi:hypothetical protein